MDFQYFHPILWISGLFFIELRKWNPSWDALHEITEEKAAAAKKTRNHRTAGRLVRPCFKKTGRNSVCSRKNSFKEIDWQLAIAAIMYNYILYIYIYHIHTYICIYIYIDLPYYCNSGQPSLIWNFGGPHPVGKELLVYVKISIVIVDIYFLIVISNGINMNNYY